MEDWVRYGPRIELLVAVKRKKSHRPHQNWSYRLFSIATAILALRHVILQSQPDREKPAHLWSVPSWHAFYFTLWISWHHCTRCNHLHCEMRDSIVDYAPAGSCWTWSSRGILSWHCWRCWSLPWSFASKTRGHCGVNMTSRDASLPRSLKAYNNTERKSRTWISKDVPGKILNVAWRDMECRRREDVPWKIWMSLGERWKAT